MTAADVLGFLDWTAAAGIPIWIDGGWAVDALLGEQTRAHRDLDIAVPVEHLTAVLDGLAWRNFARRSTDYATDWNFEFADPSGRVIDLHVLALDPTGTGGRMGDHPSAPVYPSGSLTGTGRIAGRAVACIEPAWLVRFHAGYEPDADDWRDVRALCERFGMPAPAEYDRFRFRPEILSAVRGERALMTSEIRGDPARAGALLHQDFLEFGSSGRVWRREPLLRALADDPGPQAVEPLDLDAAVLAPGCLLITYRTRSADRTTLRSSVWVLGEDGRWRLRFHQATLTDASG